MSCTEHVDASSVTVQTMASLADTEGNELYPCRSFFSVCAPLAIQCVPAIRKGEEVDILMLHEIHQTMACLNTSKFIIIIICPQESTEPLDLNDDDVRACVQMVVR